MRVQDRTRGVELLQKWGAQNLTPLLEREFVAFFKCRRFEPRFDSRMLDLLAAAVRQADDYSNDEVKLMNETALYLGKFEDGWQDLERIYTVDERVRDVRFDCPIGRLEAA